MTMQAHVLGVTILPIVGALLIADARSRAWAGRGVARRRVWRFGLAGLGIIALSLRAACDPRADDRLLRGPGRAGLYPGRRRPGGAGTAGPIRGDRGTGGFVAADRVDHRCGAPRDDRRGRGHRDRAGLDLGTARIDPRAAGRCMAGRRPAVDRGRVDVPLPQPRDGGPGPPQRPLSRVRRPDGVRPGRAWRRSDVAARRAQGGWAGAIGRAVRAVRAVERAADAPSVGAGDTPSVGMPRSARSGVAPPGRTRRRGPGRLQRHPSAAGGPSGWRLPRGRDRRAPGSWPRRAGRRSRFDRCPTSSRSRRTSTRWSERARWFAPTRHSTGPDRPATACSCSSAIRRSRQPSARAAGARPRMSQRHRTDSVPRSTGFSQRRTGRSRSIGSDRKVGRTGAGRASPGRTAGPVGRVRHSGRIHAPESYVGAISVD